MTGPFERHGVKPVFTEVGAVTAKETARQVMSYLASVGVIDKTWEDARSWQRDAWVHALTVVYPAASRVAGKAAIAELAVSEKEALSKRCPRCDATAGTDCWDMRTRKTRHTNHPHAERMLA